MSEANGAIPATERAELSPLYDEDGAERLFIEQLRERHRPAQAADAGVPGGHRRLLAGGRRHRLLRGARREDAGRRRRGHRTGSRRPRRVTKSGPSPEPPGPAKDPGVPRRLGTSQRPRRARSAVLLCVALLLAGCDAGVGGDEDTRRGPTRPVMGGSTPPRRSPMWFHEPAARGELEAVQAQVRAFNTAQDDVEVPAVRGLPAGRYDDLVRTAAADGELPDLLDFDAPSCSATPGRRRRGRSTPASRSPCARTCSPRRRTGHLPGRDPVGPRHVRSGLGLYLDGRRCSRRRVWRITEGHRRRLDRRRFTGILKKLRTLGPRGRWTLPAAVGRHRIGNLRVRTGPVVGGRRLIPRSTYRTADRSARRSEVGRGADDAAGLGEGGIRGREQDSAAFQKGRSPVSWTATGGTGEFRRPPGRRGDRCRCPLRHGQCHRHGVLAVGYARGAADGDAVWRFLAFLPRPEESCG